MAGIGVSPEAVFPYQMLFHGKNADTDYVNFVAQLVKIIRDDTPHFLRKIGDIREALRKNPWYVAADLWKRFISTKSFSGKLWSHITAATKRVVTYLIANPWLAIAIVVLIVVAWILYRARQSLASRGALNVPNVD